MCIDADYIFPGNQLVDGLLRIFPATPNIQRPPNDNLLPDLNAHPVYTQAIVRLALRIGFLVG